MKKQTNKSPNQRVALVHDYLNEAGGAERVLRVLSDMYPEARIYTAFAKNGTARRMFADRTVHESSWAWFLKIGRFYSYFRFLLPLIWKSIDLSQYDLVITSTSGGYIARGFRVSPETKVIAYCHTPPKWLYGYETPTGALGTWWGKAYLWVFGPFIRYFDYTSAQRVDVWVANSSEVARRIEKFYRKKAHVVYPPVEVNGVLRITTNGSNKGYYLTVARVTGAKGLLEAARSARDLNKRLVIVGEVVEPRIWRHLSDMGPMVTLAGRVTDQELAKYYAGAKGYIALARDEDFGMTVVEAMQCGTPVLALASGGYKETVKDGVTGLFIPDTTLPTLKKAIARFEKSHWDRTVIATWGRRFGRTSFEKSMRKIASA